MSVAGSRIGFGFMAALTFTLSGSVAVHNDGDEPCPCPSYSWFHYSLLFPGYGKRLRLCQPMLLYDVLLQSIWFFLESEFTIRHISKREV